METSDSPTFEMETGEEIYRYVERHDIAACHRVRDVIFAGAEADGYRKGYNSVPTTNDRAIAFLEPRGRETEGVRRGHYTIGDEHVDEVMLAYTF